MITANYYTKLCQEIKCYTDEEYLIIQLTQFYEVYSSEMSAIKDKNLKYLVFSNSYAEEFNINQNALNKRSDEVLSMNHNAHTKLTQEEMQLIANKTSIFSFLHVKSGANYMDFIVRKRPLINPTTNNVVGILIIMAKADPGYARRQIFNNKTYKTSTIIKNKPLSEKQQLIILSLLLGFQQRKEIAAVVNKFMYHKIDESQVKNSLRTLYTRYKCNSTEELIDLILRDDNENNITKSTPLVIIDSNSTID